MAAIVIVVLTAMATLIVGLKHIEPCLDQWKADARNLFSPGSNAAPATGNTKDTSPPANSLAVLTFELEQRPGIPPPPAKKSKKNKKKGAAVPALPAAPLVFVSGVATNSSTNAWLSVKVTFELLDAAGKVVDTNYDEIGRMEGQTDWRFRAFVTRKDVVKPRLIGIHGVADGPAR